jgi:hypothetical protein
MDKKLIIHIPKDDQGDDSEIVGTSNATTTRELLIDLNKAAHYNNQTLVNVATNKGDLVGTTDEGDRYETFDHDVLEDSGYPVC